MGQLVVFIMDVERGRPAQRVKISLSLAGEHGSYGAPESIRTEADGCARFSVPPKAKIADSRCRVEIESGAYFGDEANPSTFPVICIDFGWDGTGKMVLPVLISRHGYTTYRGA